MRSRDLCYLSITVFYIVALITAAASLAGVFFGIRGMHKIASSSQSSGRTKYIEQITSITDELDKILTFEKAYATPGQRDAINSQIEEVKSSIEGQKKSLKEVEDTLAKAQKQVEEKEVHQQEMKSVKEEDEKKLQAVLESHEQLQSESMALEQELAQSMKNLEEMLKSGDFTEEQKNLLRELDESVAQAGGRLRDLITEYDVVKERLETLQLQHKDLEDEYTRLVEQQLGA